MVQQRVLGVAREDRRDLRDVVQVGYIYVGDCDVISISMLTPYLGMNAAHMWSQTSGGATSTISSREVKLMAQIRTGLGIYPGQKRQMGVADKQRRDRSHCSWLMGREQLNSALLSVIEPYM